MTSRATGRDEAFRNFMYRWHEGNRWKLLKKETVYSDSVCRIHPAAIYRYCRHKTHRPMMMRLKNSKHSAQKILTMRNLGDHGYYCARCHRTCPSCLKEGVH